LNQDTMMKFMDYVIKEPINDEPKKGHKYPFNSCEVLCSQNVFLVDKYFENISEDDEGSLDKLQNDLSEEEIKPEAFGRTSILFDQSFTPKNVQQELDTLKIEDNSDQIEEILHEQQLPENNQVPFSEQFEQSQNFGQENNTNGDQSLKENNILLKNEKNSTKKIKYQLINYLFSYLDSESPLNFVLCGYFSKIFDHLYNSRKNIFIPYILQDSPSLIDKMLPHLNRKSIADCFTKIFYFYSKEFDTIENKKELLIKILNSLFTCKDEETFEHSINLVFDILHNRTIYYLIAKNKEIVDLIFSLTKVSIANSHHGMFKILIKFLEQVIKDIFPEVKNEKPEGLGEFVEELNMDNNELVKTDSKTNELELNNYIEIFEAIYENVEPIVEDFIGLAHRQSSSEIKIGSSYLNHSDSINSTYDKEVKVLGCLKLEEMEYIKTILELSVYLLDNPSFSNLDLVTNSIDKLFKKVLTQSLFEKMYKYFFQFEMNNFYQNIFERIVGLVTNKSIQEKYVLNIFSNFPEEIISHLFHQGIDFKTGNYILPCYYAALCKVAFTVNSSENLNLQKLLLKSKKFLKIV
jgi:hypothetical protein